MIRKLLAGGLATLALAGLCNCKTTAPAAGTQVLAKAPTTDMTDARQYYALRVYSFDTDAQQEITDAYLKGAYLPALESMADGPIGAFHRKTNAEDTARQTYVLIPLRSLAQLVAVDTLGAADGDAAARAYLQAPHDAPPYRRLETIVLRAFREMPTMRVTPLTGPRAERVYELRSYEGPTEERYRMKVDMFNAGGEVTLFDRLGFNAVFYGEVLAGAAQPNLMYMTTFDNRATRDSLWGEFGSAPEWKALLQEEKYKNTVSKNTQLFLEPTAYSGY